MNKVLISILVSIYNVPEMYLRKCIESLINQTLREIEIILVNDGSTDNSGNICDEYAKRDTRVSVIHQKNKGLSAARNAAFAASIGEYITFVDGDDRLSPNICESTYIQAKNYGLSVVMFGIVREYHKALVPLGNKNIEKDKVLEKSDCTLLQQKVLIFDSFVSTPVAKLIKSSYLRGNDISFNEKVRIGAEEFEFSLRLFENLSSTIFMSDTGYYYAYNENSITMSHNEQTYNYINMGFESAREFIYGCGQRETLLKLLYTRILYAINAVAVSGYFNPTNKMPFKKKVERFSQYLCSDIIRDAMHLGDSSELDLPRRLNLWFVRRKSFRFVEIIARIRRLQRNVQ